MKSKKITYSSLIAILSIAFVIAISFVVSKNKGQVENIKTPEVVAEEIGGIPTVDSLENLYNILQNYKSTEKENTTNLNNETTTQENTEEGNKKNEIQDESYNYYVQDNIIYISYNDKVQSKIELTSTDNEKNIINNLLVHNNDLIVIYTIEDINAQGNNLFTKIEFYNIKYKRNPKFYRELKIQGKYIDLNRVDDCIYVMTSDKFNIEALINKQIEEIDELKFKPIYGDSNISNQDIYLGFNSIYYFEDSEYKNYINILGFDLNNEIETCASSYICSEDEICFLNSGLFITKTKYDYKDAAIYGFYNNLSINSYIYKLKYNNCKVEYENIINIQGDVFDKIIEVDKFILLISENYTTWESDSKEKSIYLLDKDLNIKAKKINFEPEEKLEKYDVTDNTIVIKTTSGKELKYTLDFSNNEKPQII